MKKYIWTDDFSSYSLLCPLDKSVCDWRFWKIWDHKDGELIIIQSLIRFPNALKMYKILLIIHLEPANDLSVPTER